VYVYVTATAMGIGTGSESVQRVDGEGSQHSKVCWVEVNEAEPEAELAGSYVLTPRFEILCRTEAGGGGGARTSCRAPLCAVRPKSCLLSLGVTFP
jgi:hypothetical protein